MPRFPRLAVLATLLLALAGCATRKADPEPAALLLVSIDGLRTGDVTAEEMLALDALANADVRAP
ncbi:MAG: hypothetical protein F9K31_05535 [Dokdonella sp.]|nr:MAG: hypothetical protein F9K31_05535 [Dokdonella sp.]